jgi:DNA end-binding protein Ku
LPNVISFPGSGTLPEPPLPDRVAPVRMAHVGQDGTTLLARNAVFKGYALDGTNYAVFRQSELDALRAAKESDLQVKGFVNPSEIPQKYYDKSYDVWPDRGGEKGYELFALGLRDTGLVALGELPLYGRERAVAIQWGRRGLVLFTLFCAKEADFDKEYDLKPGLASEREMELTRELMRAQRCSFEPAALRDKYQERVLEFVLTKCQAVFPMAGGGGMPPPAPVVDFADALRKSLDMSR